MFSLNQPITIFGIPIELISLGFSIVTTFCTLLISIFALRYSAKPKIGIEINSKGNYYCGNSITLKFKVINKGHWYAQPMAIGLVIYCNFDESFEILRLRYGSRQENTDETVKLGTENMQYFEAKNIIVGSEKCGEEVWADVILPKTEGKYRIKLDAYSENGVSFKKIIKLNCIKNEATEQSNKCV